MLAAAVTQHLFWFISRAAGTAALLLSSVSVCVGLMMGGRLIKRGPDLRVVHEALSLATIVALVLHAVSLLGDSFLRPSVIDISVPFASNYMEPWMGIGIVSGYALIALGLSYYARARIGVNRWRTLHRFTALAWLGGLAHSLGEGTDAGEAWFLAATAIVTVPALVLLAMRTLQRPAGSKPAAQSPVAR